RQNQPSPAELATRSWPARPAARRVAVAERGAQAQGREPARLDPLRPPRRAGADLSPSDTGVAAIDPLHLSTAPRRSPATPAPEVSRRSDRLPRRPARR